MNRIITKKGDVFSVKIDGKHKKYFQYIANDLTQLNSDVIRAFKKSYPLDSTNEPSEILNGEVVQIPVILITPFRFKVST